MYQRLQPSFATHLLITLAISLCLALATVTAAEARSLRECERSIRVGSSLIMAGDDAVRARKLFARHSQWSLVRRSTKQMVWRKSGRSKRTVRLKLKDGRVQKVCQID